MEAMAHRSFVNITYLRMVIFQLAHRSVTMRYGIEVQLRMIIAYQPRYYAYSILQNHIEIYIMSMYELDWYANVILMQFCDVKHLITNQTPELWCVVGNLGHYTYIQVYIQVQINIKPLTKNMGFKLKDLKSSTVKCWLFCVCSNSFNSVQDGSTVRSPNKSTDLV